MDPGIDQVRAERLHGTCGVALDRAARDPQRVGDLWLSQIAPVAQDDDRPLFNREAVRCAIALEDWQYADPQRLIKVDFRPHSHHWQVMADLRASEHGTGHVEVGGTRMLCLVTGEWGDGLYPVHTDHDADGRLVQVRIVLGDEDRRQRTEAFRERWN